MSDLFIAVVAVATIVFAAIDPALLAILGPLGLLLGAIPGFLLLRRRRQQLGVDMSTALTSTATELMTEQRVFYTEQLKSRDEKIAEQEARIAKLEVRVEELMPCQRALERAEQRVRDLEAELKRERR